MITNRFTGRRSLSEIARGNVDNLRRAWDQTKAAAGFDPLPPGIYRCLVAGGEFTISRSNATPGYKIRLEVLDGEHRGRQVWHDIWLTTEAMSRAKYELGQLGITDLGQLEQPLPPGLIAEVVVTRRMGDDGIPFNKVRGFKIIAPDAPVDDFAPSAEPLATNPAGTIPPLPPDGETTG